MIPKTKEDFLTYKSNTTLEASYNISYKDSNLDSTYPSRTTIEDDYLNLLKGIGIKLCEIEELLKKDKS